MSHTSRFTIFSWIFGITIGLAFLFFNRAPVYAQSSGGDNQSPSRIRIIFYHNYQEVWGDQKVPDNYSTGVYLQSNLNPSNILGCQTVRYQNERQVIQGMRFDVWGVVPPWIQAFRVDNTPFGLCAVDWTPRTATIARNQKALFTGTSPISPDTAQILGYCSAVDIPLKNDNSVWQTLNKTRCPIGSFYFEFSIFGEGAGFGGGRFGGLGGCGIYYPNDPRCKGANNVNFFDYPERNGTLTRYVYILAKLDSRAARGQDWPGCVSPERYQGMTKAFLKAKKVNPDDIFKAMKELKGIFVAPPEGLLFEVKIFNYFYTGLPAERAKLLRDGTFRHIMPTVQKLLLQFEDKNPYIICTNRVSIDESLEWRKAGAIFEDVFGQVQHYDSEVLNFLDPSSDPVFKAIGPMPPQLAAPAWGIHKFVLLGSKGWSIVKYPFTHPSTVRAFKAVGGVMRGLVPPALKRIFSRPLSIGHGLVKKFTLQDVNYIFSQAQNLLLSDEVKEKFIKLLAKGMVTVADHISALDQSLRLGIKQGTGYPVYDQHYEVLVESSRSQLANLGISVLGFVDSSQKKLIILGELVQSDDLLTNTVYHELTHLYQVPQRKLLNLRGTTKTLSVAEKVALATNYPTHMLEAHAIKTAERLTGRQRSRFTLQYLLYRRLWNKIIRAYGPDGQEMFERAMLDDRVQGIQYVISQFKKRNPQSKIEQLFPKANLLSNFLEEMQLSHLILERFKKRDLDTLKQVSILFEKAIQTKAANDLIGAPTHLSIAADLITQVRHEVANKFGQQLSEQEIVRRIKVGDQETLRIIEDSLTAAMKHFQQEIKKLNKEIDNEIIPNL